jgi:hypothetical protein
VLVFVYMSNLLCVRNLTPRRRIQLCAPVGLLMFISGQSHMEKGGYNSPFGKRIDKEEKHDPASH